MDKKGAYVVGLSPSMFPRKKIWNGSSFFPCMCLVLTPKYVTKSVQVRHTSALGGGCKGAFFHRGIISFRGLKRLNPSAHPVAPLNCAKAAYSYFSGTSMKFEKQCIDPWENFVKQLETVLGSDALSSAGTEVVKGTEEEDASKDETYKGSETGEVELSREVHHAASSLESGPVNAGSLVSAAEANAPFLSSEFMRRTFFCTRLSECQIIASHFWHYFILEADRDENTAMERSRANEVHRVKRVLRWWEAVSRQIFLPMDVHEIEDFSLFLAEVMRFNYSEVSLLSKHHEAAEAEEKMIEDIQDWIVMHSPPVSAYSTDGTDSTMHNGRSVLPSSLAQESEGRKSKDDPLDTGVTKDTTHPTAIDPNEAISFPRLLGLLESYVRYHRGVPWGVRRSAAPSTSPSSHSSLLHESKEKASRGYYKRLYRVHPWHDMHCPEDSANQRPYVDALLWMLWGKKCRSGSRPAPPASIRGFRAPFERPKDHPFTTLDMCTQSGFAVDLLLKAGAEEVTAVDTCWLSTSNAEATYHEHMREKRSGGSGGKLRTIQADLLPAVKGSETNPRASTALSHRPLASTEAAANIYEDAARRRRRTAWELGHRLPSTSADTSSGSCSSLSSWGHQAHLVWYHPPVPSYVLPFRADSAAAATGWWRNVRKECSALPYPVPTVLPWIAFPTPMAHAHHSRRILHQLLDALTPTGEKGGRHVVLPGGFIMFMLPRTYHLHEEWMAALEKSSQPDQKESTNGSTAVMEGCLADSVLLHFDGTRSDNEIKKLSNSEGAFELIQFKRYPIPIADKTEAVWKFVVQTETVHRTGAKGSVTGGDRSTALSGQLESHFPSQWIDLVVYRRKDVPNNSPTIDSVPFTNTVQWEDTLEYDEYLPSRFPTHNHWIDQLPSYSYLEDDFLEENSLGQHYHSSRSSSVTLTPGSSAVHQGLPETNVLAHGPLSKEKIERQRANAGSFAGGLAVNRVPLAAWREDGEKATAAFQSIFREELRKKRRTKKFRHMALSSSRDQKEWYIDEKLIQSEAAKVELMNNIARFDFHQDFDH